MRGGKEMSVYLINIALIFFWAFLFLYIKPFSPKD
mgnify:CR=1 FL=1